MDTPVITTQSLTRQFGAVRALNDLTLEVPPGIVFGFLGPNGSGKTTTIRLLLGLLEPTSGSASVLGFDTRTQADRIRQESGALLEYTGLYERLSAEDNLNFFARIWAIPSAERQARIRELLDNVGLWERRGEQVGSWSRGMKQKLAVARVLLHRPRLIFLDEPTSGLDPVASAALRDDLALLAARSGVTVFLTTHNLTEAEKLCARVAVIRQGQLLAIGTPDELRRSQGGPRAEVLGRGFTPAVVAGLRELPQVKFADLENGHLVIGLADEADTAPLVSYLVSQGAQVEELRRGKASLEEVFLKLVEEEND